MASGGDVGALEGELHRVVGPERDPEGDEVEAAAVCSAIHGTTAWSSHAW